jgi:molecular chaperone DnaK
MQAVSIGAAHLAARLNVGGTARPQVAQDAPGIDLTETTARSVGIESVGPDGRPGHFSVVIPRGTLYPLKAGVEKSYRTTTVGMLRIPVYEGESSVASKNELQGVVEMELPPEVPVSTHVLVGFNYDIDRVLFVRVRISGHDDLTLEAKILREQRAEPDDAWEKALSRIVEMAAHFLATQAEHLDSGARAKLQSDIARAQHALTDHNPTIGAQVGTALRMAVTGSGTASTLHLAERAKEWAAPPEHDVIKQACRDLREAFQRNDHQEVARLQRALDSMVSTILLERAQAEQKDHALLQPIEQAAPASGRK